MSNLAFVELISGKKKAHKHRLFCPVGLGTTPGLSRGFHRVCPWEKSGENLGQTRAFSLFYTVETRFPGFVPGTNPVCPWDSPGDEGRHRKFMCLFRSLLFFLELISALHYHYTHNDYRTELLLSSNYFR